ncbi:MAG: glycosyltransferase WbpL [Acidimicrobiaceae bacterium]|jgi:UDP-N-acetylmuramyl pentapeptide phosphotransferase/UDP-N-acetylglucosamine-1-phosphate transferase|nr:glycosyltransferase WbpL [Acidimicrobiaceae bacterium]
MDTLPDVALAFGLGLAGSPVVLRVMRRVRVLDVPTGRSSHTSAIPRGGGLAPAIACVVATAFSSQLSGADREAVLMASVGLGLIGLADDLHPQAAVPRLIGQVVVALVASIWLVRSADGGVLAATALTGAVVGWLVSYVNAFNFMDGINGLAVAQVVVAGAAWGIVGWHEHVPALVSGLIPAAAVLGFAPFNVVRVKMFLGDVGSYFLGGWLGVTAIVGLKAGVPPEAVLAPLTVFLADSGVTLLRRVRRHEPWSQAHKQHAYQRLVQAGWSHGQTTLAVGSVMATVSALGALSLTGTTALRVVGDLAALAVVAGYLALPGAVSELRASHLGAVDKP